MADNSKDNNINEQVFRPWGYYRVIAKGDGYEVKVIHVNQGGQLSVQSHNHRAEHWVVAFGKAKARSGDKTFELEVGQSLDITVHAIHSLANPFDKDLEIIEVQLGALLSEDDIIRYSDIYGRA